MLPGRCFGAGDGECPAAVGPACWLPEMPGPGSCRALTKAEHAANQFEASGRSAARRMLMIRPSAVRLSQLAAICIDACGVVFATHTSRGAIELTKYSSQRMRATW